MTLDQLALRLRSFADGELTFDALRESFLPALEADPLDVAKSDARPWEDAPDDTRLYWRLIHLFDTAPEADEPTLRRAADRLVRALENAGSATTLELLPLILDQERFCTIVERTARGVISRTGFLSVVAESGYPPHVKLWLQHAGPAPLARLCAHLGAGAYAEAAAMLERVP
ncbi:MAG TPA: hypothetical protein VFS08_03275 [Gemmatimonadaceae bacterium]|nr:hypothetical protein [Gemmatimonadaceae bacterium]